MATLNLRSIAVDIDQETQDRVKRLADARNSTSHGIMQEAIRQYLDREEKREGFRQDALDALKEYQADGMHVDANEVTTWLDTWGDENELPAPTCHK